MFDLKRPCSNCPFLKKDEAVTLRAERIKELHEAATGMQGAPFFCHKTVEYSSDRPDTSRSSICAGSLVYQIKLQSPNQSTRIAGRMGLIDAKALARFEAEVHDGLTAWLTKADDLKPKRVTLRIGHCAASVMSLDDSGVCEALGLKLVRSNRKTSVYQAETHRAIALAREFEERGEASGEGWALEASERAACRRAARAIHKATKERML